MKKSFIYLLICFFTSSACNNGSNSSNSVDTASTNISNMSADTSSMMTNKTESMNPATDKSNFERRRSIEVCVSSWWNLNELWSHVNSRTTYIGFDFIPNKPPLKFWGEFFDQDPITEDTRAYDKVGLECEDPRITIGITTLNDRGHYVRRLIIGINDFRKFLHDNTDGNYAHYKLLIKPHPFADRDDLGDFVNANIQLKNTNDNTTSSQLGLHPCPYCSGTSLSNFFKDTLK